MVDGFGGNSSLLGVSTTSATVFGPREEVPLERFAG